MVDILIALILTYMTAYISKKILNYLYVKFDNEFAFYFWMFWKRLKYEIVGQYLNIIVGAVLFSMFYFIITYRKAKNFVSIIEETKIMANGDLDRVIQVNGEGDIKNLAENINNI